MDISKLGIKVVPKQVRPKGRTPKIKDTCYNNYHLLTKDAMLSSIMEAKGRFDLTNDQYGPEDKAYGSTFWRPVAGAQGIDEIVEVYWKIGKRKKIPLFEHMDERYDTLRVPFEQVLTLLNAMEAELNKADFKQSFNGQLFHAAAIEASRPKKATQQAEVFYHAEKDMWLKRADYADWETQHKAISDVYPAAAELLGLQDSL